MRNDEDAGVLAACHGQRFLDDLAAIVTLARIGLAARALGAVSRGFDLTLDYAKVRVQFGKKIGQFQATAETTQIR